MEVDAENLNEMRTQNEEKRHIELFPSVRAYKEQSVLGDKIPSHDTFRTPEDIKIFEDITTQEQMKSLETKDRCSNQLSCVSDTHKNKNCYSIENPRQCTSARFFHQSKIKDCNTTEDDAEKTLESERNAKLNTTNLINECHAEYRRIMRKESNFVKTEQVLTAVHDKTKDKVCKMFRNQSSIRDSDIMESYLGLLEEKMDQTFTEFAELCTMKTTVENAKTMVLLMECRQQYIAEMEKECSNEFFITLGHLNTYHFKAMDIVVKNLAKTYAGSLTKAHKEDFMKEMEIQFQLFKMRNDKKLNWTKIFGIHIVLPWILTSKYFMLRHLHIFATVLVAYLLFYIMGAVSNSLFNWTGKRLPRNCEDILKMESKISQIVPSGVYEIYVAQEGRFIEVYCDMNTNGGGWIVIQRRCDSDFWTAFSRDWNEYVNGFGMLENSHWLGLDKISWLTNSDVYKLRVDLMDMSGEERYAEYKVFRVANASSFYKLHVEGYAGNAGDSLISENGKPFSTRDRENHNPTGLQCLNLLGFGYRGSWWSSGCHLSGLNGIYGCDLFGMGINWHSWKGHYDSMKRAEMKIRTHNYKPTS